MKIIFFDFTTMVGGATKGTLYLLRRLKDKGINTSVIDVYGSCEEHISDIKHSGLPYNILYKKNDNVVIGYMENKARRALEFLLQSPDYLAILLELYKVLDRERPDYILINNEKSLAFLLLFKRLLGFKIVLYYRGEANKSQMTKRFVAMVNFGVDVSYCHSKNAIENMHSFGIKNKVHYLPNCISFNPVATTNDDNIDYTIMLNAGRVVREKGYHTAIKAVGVLKEKGYIVRLLLPGLLVDEEYTLLLNSLIEKFELVDSVSFLGWVDNLTEVLSASNCMILPSHSEGFPRSIIESMLLKIPICATPVGGIPEAIFHNETGYLFEIDDYNDLAICLQSIIDQPDNTYCMVQNAYNFASKHFNEDLNTSVFIKNLG